MVFYNHNLTNVVLPEGLISIGNKAFHNNQITNVNLPNTLTSIGSLAFYNNQISSIIIPLGITVIEEGVFSRNDITELTIPNNVTMIKGEAFCFNKITSLTIPNSIIELGPFSFSDNTLKELIFEDDCKLKAISGGCFDNNDLTAFVLPNSIKNIENNAFANNYNLSSIQLSNELMRIGNRAFYSCNLNSVNLPDKLFHIGSDAFSSNPSLAPIQLPNQSVGENWTVSDGSIKNNGELINDFSCAYIVKTPYTLKDEDVIVSNGFITSCSYTNNLDNFGNFITIPSILNNQVITGIGNGVFLFKYMLGVNLPDSLQYIGEYSFYRCEIISLNIPSSVELIDVNAFSENNINTLFFVPKSNIQNIIHGAFGGNKLQNIVIPQSVKTIGEYAFAYNPLTSVGFEDSCQILSIENNAFDKGSLSNFILPEPIIEGYTYKGWIDGNGMIHQKENNNMLVDDIQTFYRVLLEYTLTDNDVVVENGTIISCSYDFTASIINIPDTLDNQLIIGIGPFVFQKKGIVEIKLPSQLKTIGSYAFSNNNLLKLNIPQNVNYIDIDAFKSNYIKKLSFENNSQIETIDNYAFEENLIDTLILPNSLKYIGDQAFYNNQISNDITLPPLLKELGDFAFDGNNIQHVFLNQSITDIGEGAFLNNPNVTIDPLPNPVTIPFVTWFIRWRDNDNNTLYPGYIITDFSKGYYALIDQYLHVNVQVEDDNGRPVEGAIVEFSDSIMITDAFGLDSIAPVERGEHSYTVSADNCQTVTGTVDVQDDTSLKFTLIRLYNFTLNVVDLNNNPVEGAIATIEGTILISDLAGSATTKFSDGEYFCEVRLPGYSIGSSNFTIHDADTSITIQLNAAVITYYPNGGEQPAYSDTATGSNYHIHLNSFTFNGYSFTVWNTEPDSSGITYNNDIDLTLATSDLDLHAIWEINNYSISYDTKGGNNDPSNPLTYTVESDTIYLQPALPTASTEPFFEGWFDDDNNKIEFIPKGSTGDVKIWASFIPEPIYTINYLNVFDVANPNPSVYTQYDLPINLIDIERTGYYFGGWFSDINYINSITQIALGTTGDITLYAKWEILYNLNFVITTDGSTPAEEVSISINDSINLVSDNQGLAAYICREGFSYTYKVVLDDIEITSGNGLIDANDETINVSIVNAYMRWNDVLFCDNGKQLWSGFEWYKSGTLVSSEQFYYNEGGIPEADYSLIVTTQSGKKHTWQQHYSNQTFSMSVYPNPLLKSGNISISIKGLDDYNNCQLLIYNLSGQVIAKLKDVASYNTFNQSLPAGSYKIAFIKDGKNMATQHLMVH